MKQPLKPPTERHEIVATIADWLFGFRFNIQKPPKKD